MSRKPWELDFTAEPAEVAALRRVMRLHLRIWGLYDIADDAQLCVSELVSNVVNHVGIGTPATLAVSMMDTRLRIEVHDPDTRALPTLIAKECDAEEGRGMALVDALAVRWGVEFQGDRKSTWCELATALSAPHGHLGSPGVARAEALLGPCSGTQLFGETGPSKLGSTILEDSVIGVVTDLLQWLHAHGCDSDEIFDRAQRRFDARTGT